MNPYTGQLEPLVGATEDELYADAKKRGLVRLPDGVFREVEPLAPSERLARLREWQAVCAQLNTHPAARTDGETDDDARQARNQRKRQRKQRR